MDVMELLSDGATLLGTIGIVLGIFYFVVQSTNSFKLLRRFHAGSERGNPWAVMGTIAAIAAREPFALFSREKRFFRRVRMRLEHEIFHPRPVFHWPLTDEDERFGEPGYRVDHKDKSARELRVHRREVYRRVRADWRPRRDGWRKDMARIFAPETQTIVVDNAGDLNDSLGDIKHYFNVLRTLAIDVETDVKFLCPVRVSTGFIAPLHLLAGLLTRYNEKWTRILAGFERDTSDIRKLEAFGRAAADIRQVQSFIYHCWLLWGPSIPLCDDSCGWWSSRYLIVQYGFGDENNSIEVVGEREEVLGAVAELLRKYQPGALATSGGAFTGMAIPASVTGLLQYSSIADMGDIPEALKQSWQGKQDERPILYLSARDAFDAHEGRMSGSDFDGGIGPELVARDLENPPARYYSAYLWVMFVLLRKVDDRWVVLHAPEAEHPSGGIAKSSQPWKSSIPFFEHANLADAESCAFGKRQLAAKALTGLVELVSRLPADGSTIRLAYASAVDDPNCGRELAIPALRGGTSIAARMRRQLSAARPGDPLARLNATVAGAPLLDFEFFSAEAGRHPHSGCSLPGHISAHYDWLDQVPVDA